MILLAVLLLSSSCSYAPYPLSDYDVNPFLDKISIGAYDGSGRIRFSAVTDMHFRRYNDGPVKWFNENYYSHLESGDYSFAVSLGDLTDDGIIDGTSLGFISRVRSLAGYLIECIGNHDRHNLSPRWDSGDEVFTTASAYSFGEIGGRPLLSIYKLDTSERAIGDLQFRYLEEALAADDSLYRIFITHEIITSGGVPDISAVLFGLNIQERNHLYRLMDQYGIGLILTGHYHKGNIEYHMKESMGEFNLAAYHQRLTKPFEYESIGYWYSVSIDVDNGKAEITPYSAESGMAQSPFVFSLPRN